MNKPLVAVRILIFKNNQLLLGERINTHKQGDWGPTWGPPGGHLELGESFENCAIREAREEIGIDITNPKFHAVTNDFYAPENKHYVTIFMRCELSEDMTIKNMEPEKISQWKWFDWNDLPENIFLSMKNLITTT